MNPPPTPPPVPFGDPTRVRAENSAAVGKGIAIGCGGCALIGLAVLVLTACVVAGVFGMIRSSDACDLTLKAANSSEVMKRELGEPITLGWFVGGSVNINNGHRRANVSMTLIGPKGEADAHTIGTREGDSPWVWSEMSATIKPTKERVDLRSASQ